jgi:hypothetical protein
MANLASGRNGGWDSKEKVKCTEASVYVYVCVGRVHTLVWTYTYGHPLCCLGLTFLILESRQVTYVSVYTIGKRVNV